MGLALVALAAGLRFPRLVDDPVLSPDVAIYHTVAAEMDRGAVLYRDVRDHKPPGIYLFYGAVRRLTRSERVEAVNVAFVLVVVLTALVGMRVARRGGSEVAGRLAAFLYVIAAAAPRQIVDADAEMLMALPLALAVERMLCGRGTRAAFAAGGALGVGTLVKYQGGILLPLGLWIYGRSAAGPDRLRHLGAFLGGGLAVVAVLFAALFLVGDPGAFLRYGFLYNFVYMAEPSGGIFASGVLSTWGRAIAIVGLCWGGLVAGALLLGLLRRTPAGPEPADAAFVRRGVLVWLLLSIVAVIPGWIAIHYFGQILLPLSILAAWGWSRLALRFRGGPAAALGLALVCVGGYHVAYRRSAEPAHRAVARNVAVGEWIRERAAPDESIYVLWAPLVSVYVHADRPVAHPWIPSGGLIRQLKGHPKSESLGSARWIPLQTVEEMERTFRERNLRFLVDPEGRSSRMRQLVELSPYLRSRFRPAESIDGVAIWERIPEHD